LSLRRGYRSLKNLVAKLLEVKGAKALDADEYIRGIQRLSDEVINRERAEYAAKIFSTLADPVRIRILKLLEKESMCVCELMIALRLRQSLVSYHLKMLREGGFVKPVKKGRWIFYKITDKKLVRWIFKIIEIEQP
jgi:DNA-binding transcriptional ArsR family regulator